MADEELAALGVEIVQRRGTSIRCLRVPAASVEGYLDLVAARLQPTYWNEVVGQRDIRFVFKLEDGSVRETSVSSGDPRPQRCS